MKTRTISALILAVVWTLIELIAVGQSSVVRVFEYADSAKVVTGIYSRIDEVERQKRAKVLAMSLNVSKNGGVIVADRDYRLYLKPKNATNNWLLWERAFVCESGPNGFHIDGDTNEVDILGFCAEMEFSRAVVVYGYRGQVWADISRIGSASATNTLPFKLTALGLPYIGKSHQAGRRIPSSLRDKEPVIAINSVIGAEVAPGSASGTYRAKFIMSDGARTNMLFQGECWIPERKEN